MTKITLVFHKNGQIKYEKTIIDTIITIYKEYNEAGELLSAKYEVRGKKLTFEEYKNYLYSRKFDSLMTTILK